MINMSDKKVKFFFIKTFFDVINNLAEKNKLSIEE